MNGKTQIAIHNKIIESTGELLNAHWSEILDALESQNNSATVNVSFKIDTSKPIARLNTGISFYTGRVNDKVDSEVDPNQLELL